MRDTWFTSNFARQSHWKDVYEQRVDIENSGEESSDSGDNGFEATILTSKGTFEPHNSCFGGKKWKDNQHYETDNLQPKDFQEIFEEQCEEENFGCDATQLQIWEYLKKKQ